LENRLRILFHTVSPWTRSGYGNLCKNIGVRLAKRYLVIASCYYGIEPGGVINYHGLLVVPSKLGSFGEISAQHYNNLFKIDVSVLMTDGWAFPWFPHKMNYPVFYGPMDSYNYPEEVIDIFRHYQLLISPSKFQVEEWKKYGLEYLYIPHGVDINIFKPIPKEEARNRTNIPMEKFIIGMVGANADKEPRKSWDRMFKGIRLFLENNPDARNDIRIYVHSNPRDPRGINLENFARKQGLLGLIGFENPLNAETGMTDTEMAYLYNSFDILLHTSLREGFGLCMLESMACGTPVIATNTTSMIELVKGHGWLCDTALKGLNMISTPLNAECTIPDVYSIATCLEDAYSNESKRKKYAAKSRRFALNFNWDDIINTKWIPLFDDIKENKLVGYKKSQPREMIGLTVTKDKLMKELHKKVVKK